MRVRLSVSCRTQTRGGVCDGHSGSSLGCYAALVGPSALEGSAPQHPIGLIKADEELLLLLLWQKTRFCRIDVLQETKKDVQVPFGNVFSLVSTSWLL